VGRQRRAAPPLGAGTEGDAATRLFLLRRRRRGFEAARVPAQSVRRFSPPPAACLHGSCGAGRPTLPAAAARSRRSSSHRSVSRRGGGVPWRLLSAGPPCRSVVHPRRRRPPVRRRCAVRNVSAALLPRFCRNSTRVTRFCRFSAADGSHGRPMASPSSATRVHPVCRASASVLPPVCHCATVVMTSCLVTGAPPARAPRARARHHWPSAAVLPPFCRYSAAVLPFWRVHSSCDPPTPVFSRCSAGVLPVVCRCSATASLAQNRPRKKTARGVGAGAPAQQACGSVRAPLAPGPHVRRRARREGGSMRGPALERA